MTPREPYCQHNGVNLGLHEETEGFEAGYIHTRSFLVLQDVWNNLLAYLGFFENCLQVYLEELMLFGRQSGHTKY